MTIKQAEAKGYRSIYEGSKVEAEAIAKLDALKAKGYKGYVIADVNKTGSSRHYGEVYYRLYMDQNYRYDRDMAIIARDEERALAEYNAKMAELAKRKEENKKFYNR